MDEYPYLDITVLPDIRQFVVSARAAIVFSPDLQQVIWANGQGTRLLGYERLSQTLAGGLNGGSVMGRQIAGAVARLSSRQTVSANMRVMSGWQYKLTGFTVSKINLPDDQLAVLLTSDPLHGRAFGLAEMAATELSNLEGSGTLSAVLGAEGGIVAASTEFLELTVEDELLAMLVSEVAEESDRLVKRLVTIGDGELAAGIARLAGNTHLLILASEPDSPEIYNQAPDNIEKLADAAPNDQPHDEIPDEVEPTEIKVGQFSSRRPRLDKNDGVAIRWYYRKLTAKPEENPPVAEPEKPGNTKTVPPADEQIAAAEPSVGKEGDNGASEPQAPVDQAEPSEEFRFENTGKPVRFVWHMDADYTFLSVSPELAKAIGPLAADVVGLRWHDIARTFRLDDDGTITRCLERGDTWSGKSVMWPVEGSDLVVPIDLAGLPSFGRDRQFAGFHGFGTIRTGEAEVDPDKTGLALAGMLADHQAEADDNADNPVIDLQAQRQARQLSPVEQAAFVEIGDRLSQQDGDKTTDKPATVEAAGLAYLPSAFANLPPAQTDNIDTSILSGLPIPVMVFRNNALLFSNSSFEQLTGYADDQQLADAGGIEALLGAPDDNQDGYTSIRHADGHQIAVKAHLQSVPWGGSRALLLALRVDRDGAGHDPKAPDNAEISATAGNFQGISPRELSSILDTATDGVVVLSADGQIHAINQAAEALFGYQPDDVKGQDFTHLLARESHQVARDYITSLSEEGIASLLNDGREMIGKEAQGGLIPLFVTMGRLEDSELYCAVLRDITQWKKTEEDLVTARQQAELASNQKTDFLAKISHEIRTPLNAIIGFSEVMLEERFGKITIDRYREYLRDINRSGNHVLELVNDLLDISKIEAGKLELDFSEVKLNDIVAEGVAMLQPQANRNHIIIRTSLSGAVPKVVADPRSIRQIVLNLVSNAIKYTNKGGQVIVSTVFEETGEVVLRVRDTGIGMSENDIITALTPFRQVRSVSRSQGEGTGLGLPLTKALVEANRAQFSIESTPGEGTLVEVYFPSTRVLTD